MSWGPDRWRLYGLALRETGRAMRESLSWGLSRLRMSSPSPTRLLFAPQDLRTADPTIATEIYSGFFAFAGRSITTGGRSPFGFAPPSRAWAEALYGFGWLRHLRAAGTALAQANARSLVDEFVSSRLGDRRIADRSADRRAPADLVHQPIAPHPRGRRSRLLSTLPAHRRQSRARSRAGRCGPAPCPNSSSWPPSRSATRAFAARGSRNRCAVRPGFSPANWIGRSSPMAGMPAAIRACWSICCSICCRCGRCSPAARSTRPEALLHAIDRMLPMVRLFRHGDGTLSHFNGMGVTAADHLATLLTYDDMRSQPIHHAPLFRLRADGGRAHAPRGRCGRPRRRPPCRPTPAPVASPSNFRAARSASW